MRQQAPAGKCTQAHASWHKIQQRGRRTVPARRARGAGAPTSGGARLTSSSSSQAPLRSARTSAPSANANAKPPSATAAARSAAASSPAKRRQSSLRPRGARYRMAAGPWPKSTVTPSFPLQNAHVSTLCAACMAAFRPHSCPRNFAKLLSQRQRSKDVHRPHLAAPGRTMAVVCSMADSGDDS